MWKTFDPNQFTFRSIQVILYIICFKCVNCFHYLRALFIWASMKSVTASTASTFSHLWPPTVGEREVTEQSSCLQVTNTEKDVTQSQITKVSFVFACAFFLLFSPRRRPSGWRGISTTVLFFKLLYVYLFPLGFQDERGMTFTPMHQGSPTASVDASWVQQTTYHGGNNAQKVNECGFNWQEARCWILGHRALGKLFLSYRPDFSHYHHISYLYAGCTACSRISSGTQNWWSIICTLFNAQTYFS